MPKDHSRDVLEEHLGPFVTFWDFYLQTEAGAVKRITIPAAYYNTARYLHTNPEGRSPSHLDTDTRRVLDREPHLTYAEALCKVLDTFHDQPGFWGQVGEALADPERFSRDQAMFWAVLDAREESWRTANNDHRPELPALFD